MTHVLLAANKIVLIGMLFGLVLLHAGSSDTIVIQVLDGKSGKPIPNEHLLIFQGATAEDVRAQKNPSKALKTDANGVAILPLDDPSILKIQVWVDWHVLCQEKPNEQSYGVENIRKTGLSSPNNCGSLVRENTPNHLIVFSRSARPWEKMRYYSW
jgi:hypothetical protein